MADSTNNRDAFEQKLKDSMEHYAVPYNSADWAQMERALSSGVRGWGHGRALVAGLLVAGGLLIGGTAYILGRDNAAPEIETVGVPTASKTVEATTHPKEMTPVAAQEPTVQMEEVATKAIPIENTGNLANSEHAAAAKHAASARKASGGTTASATPEANPTPSAPHDAASAATLFRTSTKESCTGSPVDFTVEHMPEDGIYLWNFGDGSFSNKANPQHTFTKAGTYQVMLSMSTVGMGTIRNKPSSDMIVIHEAPAANFNVVKLEYPGLLPSVHFENKSMGAKSYLWDFGDGTTGTEAHPDHVYKAKGVYKVELTITNETGCEDRKMKEVRIDKDLNLGAPASFSPNGDGLDETFMPESLKTLTGKFEMSIYNPAGLLVYRTSDASHPWCGKLKDQETASAPGEYVWVVNVESNSQAAETFTGKVKLLR